MPAIDEISAPNPLSIDTVRRSQYRGMLSATFIFSATTIILFVVVAVFAPLIAPHDPLRLFPGQVLKPASSDFLLGTDELGRDLLSRVIYGAQLSLVISFCAVGISTILGVVLGIIASYYGGIVDMIIMRSVDIIMSFPSMILVIAVVAYLGNTISNLIIVMGLIYTPGITRIMYTMTLSVRQKDYIEAAQAIGVPSLRIMLLHVLPNAMAPLLAHVALSLGFVILTESGLSFLGLGPPPPTPTWGSLISIGRQYIHRQPMLLFVPVLAVSLIILAFNLLGDSLRDILDPRLRKG